MTYRPDVGALEACATRFSREIRLWCDVGGVVGWADERAERLLGLRAGETFETKAAPGTEEKLRSLLERGCEGQVEDWEISVVVNGAPATVSFGATPCEDGVLLLGALVPAPLSQAIDTFSAAMNEVVALNRQVLNQKRALERQNDELLRTNRELEESNRAIMAMHVELEDKSVELQRQAEIKTRVVAHVSHEFRTPLHSTLGLAQLLLDEVDGPLTGEQKKQVTFIRSATEELLHMADDVLDLTRVEAGRAALRATHFSVSEFLASLRGMLKPLARLHSTAKLLIAAPEQDIELETDRGKLAQIMRNLLSNALKFTREGEVRVRVAYDAQTTMVSFVVSDTGTGIPAEKLDSVFEEFTQIEENQPEHIKGSGLGLPLSQRFAHLLGGMIVAESEVGRGSTFTLTIPTNHPEIVEMEQVRQRSRGQTPGPSSILVVEDDRKTIFMYERYLAMAGFHVIPARTIEEARAVLEESPPAAIVLDIMLEAEASWNFLAEVKRDPKTAEVPVLVVTVTNREEKARALGADEFWLKPVDRDRLIRKLKSLARPEEEVRVLMIDDDEKSRYVIRRHLRATPYRMYEAASGPEGVKMAQEELPQVILLDFLLENMTAFDVLDDLKADPVTRAIPVIIITSHILEVADRERLLQEADSVISKQSLSRELAINRIRDALRKAGLSSGTT